MINLEKVSKETCSICLDEIERHIIGDRNYLFILDCNHSYHYNCFLSYVRYNLSKIKETNYIECPLCRTKVKICDIMYSIVDKFYNMKLRIKNLERRRKKLKNTLLYFNFGKCLCFIKSDLSIQEENLMSEIEKYDCMIRKTKQENKDLVKIYDNLINKVEVEICYFP